MVHIWSKLRLFYSKYEMETYFGTEGVLGTCFCWKISTSIPCGSIVFQSSFVFLTYMEDRFVILLALLYSFHINTFLEWFYNL